MWSLDNVGNDMHAEPAQHS